MCLFKGSFATIKRNSRYLANCIKANTTLGHEQKDIAVETRDLCVEMKKLMIKYTYNMTRSSREIDAHFPISDHNSLLLFLREEGLEQRKEQFENYLLLVATDKSDKKRQFSDALSSALFKRDYMMKKKWPLNE